MEDPNCPNYTTCKLVTTEGVGVSNNQKVSYLNKYCTAGKAAWSVCKRYVTKPALGFCPDFVLPDTSMSLPEIIDRFDEENEN